MTDLTDSLALHDWGWIDSCCVCRAPARGSYLDHYYCREHLITAIRVDTIEAIRAVAR